MSRHVWLVRREEQEEVGQVLYMSRTLRRGTWHVIPGRVYVLTNLEAGRHPVAAMQVVSFADMRIQPRCPPVHLLLSGRKTVSADSIVSFVPRKACMPAPSCSLGVATMTVISRDSNCQHLLRISRQR